MEIEVSFGKVRGTAKDLARLDTLARDLARRFDPRARVQAAFRKDGARTILDVDATIGGERLNVTGGGRTLRIAIDAAFRMLTSRLAWRAAHAAVVAA